MNPTLAYFVARLREPSTYAGAAVLIGGMTFIPNAAGVAGTVVAIGTAICGVLAIWLPEKKA